jgi:lysozyme
MATRKRAWTLATAVVVNGLALAPAARAQAVLPQSVYAPAVRAAAPPSIARAVLLAPVVDAAARRHDIDPLLLHAIAYVESRHDAQAVSRAGARGVMQVMPGTARRFGVADAGSLHDAGVNLDAGASYLKALQQRFGNDLRLVLAAYNAGEGAVERHGTAVPPFPETQAYVRDVLARYAALTSIARRMRGARGLT